MKTIDEELKVIEKTVNGKLSTAFKKGVEFAQRWIPVEEEAPTVNEDNKFDLKYGYSKEVLLKMKDGKCAVGFYCKNSNSFSLKGSVLAYQITHWRPIERE